MKRCYAENCLRESSLTLVDEINRILSDYERRGYVLTVRQVYYQLVTANIIKNNEKEYKHVSRLINEARMGGLIDWDMIEDRTRDFSRRQRWVSPKEILSAAATSYHEDLWKGQTYRVFVVVEKDALSGVLEPACEELDIPLLAARGYASTSVLHGFAEDDLVPAIACGQTPVVLYLGDHDPSGIDMTRDICDRLATFTGQDVLVHRIALNMDQIKEMNPPENPAKTTDRRFMAYMRTYGTSSWELDALDPDYLDRLVRDCAEEYIDHVLWNERKAAIEMTRQGLWEIVNERGGIR